MSKLYIDTLTLVSDEKGNRLLSVKARDTTGAMYMNTRRVIGAIGVDEARALLGASLDAIVKLHVEQLKVQAPPA